MVDLKELLGVKDFEKLDDTAMVDVAEHAEIIDFKENDRLVAEQYAGNVLCGTKIKGPDFSGVTCL